LQQRELPTVLDSILEMTFVVTLALVVLGEVALAAFLLSLAISWQVVSQHKCKWKCNEMKY
jgi:hypothetical protein